MKIKLNQQDIKIPTEETTLSDILKQSRLPLSRVAVRVNNSVIPKVQWQSKVIHENDNIETIILVSGG
jgi:thiamine biosynthesis protein ThiS